MTSDLCMSNLFSRFAVFVLFLSITKELKLRSTVLFNSSSSCVYFFLFVHRMTLSMWVNWWSNISFFFSLCVSLSLFLRWPHNFILIINGGQQFIALSLTRKRAVRTTLRNFNFVISKKTTNKFFLLLLFLLPQVDYSILNVIRHNGE